MVVCGGRGGGGAGCGKWRGWGLLGLPLDGPTGEGWQVGRGTGRPAVLGGLNAPRCCAPPAGFELGIKSMKPGGKRRIVVPPELGPPVGPATFFSAKQYEVFDVELRSVKTCRCGGAAAHAPSAPLTGLRWASAQAGGGGDAPGHASTPAQTTCVWPRRWGHALQGALPRAAGQAGSPAACSSRGPCGAADLPVARPRLAGARPWACSPAWCANRALSRAQKQGNTLHSACVMACSPACMAVWLIQRKRFVSKGWFHPLEDLCCPVDSSYPLCAWCVLLHMFKQAKKCPS